MTDDWPLLPDHCLEVIRISLACTADISLYTFRWGADHSKKPGLKSNSRRYCVNWEALDVWNRKRSLGFSPELKSPEWMVEDAHGGIRAI